MKNKLFKKIVYIFIMASQNDINTLIDIYFQQSNILYTHLFDSYNIFIRNIIPYALSENNFYENIIKDKIYVHGFKCKDIIESLSFK